MASLFVKRQHTCANLFATACLVLYFIQEISGNDDYVDFLRKANDRLTVEALSAFAEDPGDKNANIIFSPSSVLTGIGMLYRGMDGDTRENVRRIMGFPPKAKTFRNGFKMLTKGALRNATNTDTNPKFTANMITVNTDNQIKNAYAVDIKTVFNGNPYHEKFSKDPEKTRKNINTWVSKRTNSKIKNLLPPDGVKADTLVVLVNVLYFKDDWKDDPFEADPIDGTFKLGNGENVTAKFMESDDVTIGYKELNDAEIISLPFSNDNYYMVIVAPKETSDPETILRKIGTDSGLIILDHVSSPKDTLTTESVKLKMPVFKAGMAKNLVEIMDTIGLSEIMAPDANYGKLSKNPVQVDAINHKAVIDVNTNGVEAAAATAISIVPKFGRLEADKQVIINRPFLYFIVEDSKKIIHFAGILRDPNAGVEDK